ncbi:MAG: hypothetical protein AB4206_00750 [Xenococcaceae cyanobacterium]
MIKDFTNFLTRFMTAVVFTSLLISCQKTSQNQPSIPQPTEYQSEYSN